MLIKDCIRLSVTGIMRNRLIVTLPLGSQQTIRSITSRSILSTSSRYTLMISSTLLPGKIGRRHRKKKLRGLSTWKTSFLGLLHKKSRRKYQSQALLHLSSQIHQQSIWYHLRLHRPHSPIRAHSTSSPRWAMTETTIKEDNVQVVKEATQVITAMQEAIIVGAADSRTLRWVVWLAWVVTIRLHLCTTILPRAPTRLTTILLPECIRPKALLLAILQAPISPWGSSTLQPCRNRCTGSQWAEACTRLCLHNWTSSRSRCSRRLINWSICSMSWRTPTVPTSTRLALKRAGLITSSPAIRRFIPS